MVANLTRTRFRGGLNYYRNIDHNWEFIAGSIAPTLNGTTGKPQLEAMSTTIPNLQRKVIIEGAGHFIQLERTQQVNAELIQFLRSFPGVG